MVFITTSEAEIYMKIYEKYIKDMMLSPRESSRNIKLLFLNKTTNNSSKFLQLSHSDVEAIDANAYFFGQFNSCSAQASATLPGLAPSSFWSVFSCLSISHSLL